MGDTSELRRHTPQTITPRTESRTHQSSSNNQASVWLEVLGTFAILGTFFTTYMYMREPIIHEEDYTTRTDKILATAPLIDGHNDLPYLLRLELQNKIYDNTTFSFRDRKFCPCIFSRAGPQEILLRNCAPTYTTINANLDKHTKDLASHTDLLRMKEGRIGGQFWSVFVECPDLKDLDDPAHCVRDTLEQIDVAKRFIDDVGELYYCKTSSCVQTAFKVGKIPSMLGAEGLHQTGSSIAVIRQLYELGVRYITATHNCDNPYATAASSVTVTGKDSGLTEFGAAAIKEMNRLGMMIDLSHTSHKAMRQILDITASPVIFSHSTCYELAKNYRNAPDDVIARLKDNGGVLMVMFVKRFLNAENPNLADIETVVDHIMHVVQVAGWDHVGIGGDFDGTVTLAKGIESVADYPKLINAVMSRGATDKQIRKLVGENILRVWLQNEVNAAVISLLDLPVEDNWEGRCWGRI